MKGFRNNPPRLCRASSQGKSGAVNPTVHVHLVVADPSPLAATGVLRAHDPGPSRTLTERREAIEFELHESRAHDSTFATRESIESLMRPLHPVDEVVRQDPEAVPRGELEIVPALEGGSEVLPPPPWAEVELRVRELPESIELGLRQPIRHDDSTILIQAAPVEVRQGSARLQRLVQLRPRVRGEHIELSPVRERPERKPDRVHRGPSRLSWQPEDERAVRLDVRLLGPSDRLFRL